MEKTYDVRLWDKVEHWYFDITVEAVSEQDLIARVYKMYSRKRYSINHWA